ncbi:hypothetical protein BDF20DRAFT_825781 [Mycotypha africana]|uniref:uncharacterized protein n=1 Tax=Mycotypha africana TaxID=64632 RepID=UPI0023008A7A|nr:uncharacterized protein BDF20DRAFT_825781 [Mycotypha africana]KAI8970240.1 hypothetical protein BDF20DRAFT_825781 [Mycotypha africana]
MRALELLLRFGIGWHPKTKLYWAFPTFKKVKGLGYYVHLQKEVLESLQKGAYNATFRGVATYRTDMLQHVEQLLFKQPLSEMQQCPSNIYHTVRPTSSKSKWEVDDSQKQLAPMGYQCILSFNQTDIRPFCELDHQIGDQKNIPCYNMYKLCSTDAAAKLLSDVRILSNEPVAFALPKQPGTLNLAISLWRCRQFIS